MTGEVEEVTPTRETRDLRLGNNAAVPVRVMRATVRTLGVNKGELAFRFEFRFLTLNTEQPIVNGPNLAYVQPGGRYRFYLKKSDDFYVSMLDGEFDDGFAVHPLAPDEACG